MYKLKIRTFSSTKGEEYISRMVQDYISISFNKDYAHTVSNLRIIFDNQEIDIEDRFVTQILLIGEDNKRIRMLYLDCFPSFMRGDNSKYPEWPIQTGAVNMYRDRYKLRYNKAHEDGHMSVAFRMYMDELDREMSKPIEEDLDALYILKYIENEWSKLK